MKNRCARPRARPCGEFWKGRRGISGNGEDRLSALASGFRLSASGFGRQASDLGPQTSGFRPQTSDFALPTGKAPTATAAETGGATLEKRS